MFIRMLTDEGDTVLDPFGGSCVTGEASEKLNRKWICVELEKEYIEGAKLRFPIQSVSKKTNNYTISHPAALWETKPDLLTSKELLPSDGGKKRPKTTRK